MIFVTDRDGVKRHRTVNDTKEREYLMAGEI